MTPTHTAVTAATWIEESDVASVVALRLCMDDMHGTESPRDTAQFLAQVRGHLRALRMTPTARAATEPDPTAGVAVGSLTDLSLMRIAADLLRFVTRGDDPQTPQQIRAHIAELLAGEGIDGAAAVDAALPLLLDIHSGLSKYMPRTLLTSEEFQRT